MACRGEGNTAASFVYRPTVKKERNNYMETSIPISKSSLIKHSISAVKTFVNVCSFEQTVLHVRRDAGCLLAFCYSGNNFKFCGYWERFI